MKITTAIAIIMLLVCCKPKPLRLYHLSVHTSDFENSEKQYTIMAINDTLAYQAAYKAFASKMYTAQGFKSKYPNADITISKTIDFKITDNEGTSIKKRLSKKVVDSLESRIDVVVNKMNQYSH